MIQSIDAAADGQGSTNHKRGNACRIGLTGRREAERRGHDLKLEVQERK